MTDERKQGQAVPDETQDRIGKYGGDDGALEHERAEIEPGEDPGIKCTLVPSKGTGTPSDEAERKQERDLETGEENPG